jgi:RNA polymerase sigma factor (sigma-70 family)
MKLGLDRQPTVFIIDDDLEVRSAIALLMRAEGLRYETFESAWHYLTCFDAQRPGCLVLDVRMHDMNGLELQQHLLKKPIYPPIIMITGHGDVPMAVHAIQSGAIDFLEKPFNDDTLLAAIERGFKLDAQRRHNIQQSSTVHERLNKLTKREKEILDLIIAGKRNKVIAADLGISQSTVEAHRAKVMDKLEARSLSDLMRMILISGVLL